jgi:hypothetical protein
VNTRGRSVLRKFLSLSDKAHDRHRQHTAGLWRATDDCPSTFRIQAGDLSDQELKHVKSCHLCLLIHDLTRFDRAVSRVRLQSLKGIRWVKGSSAAPLTFGAMVVLGLILFARAGNENSRASTSVHGSASIPSAQSGNVFAHKAVNDHAEGRKREEVELRSLPVEIEMQRRLGPRFGREFEQMRFSIGTWVPPDSELGERLSVAWLETLRVAGNGLFIEILHYQVSFAPRIPPETLVNLAEIHNQLAHLAGRRYVLSLLRVEAQTLDSARKESGQSQRAKAIGERVLKEAQTQKAAADPRLGGQAEAVRAAEMRREAATAVARR